MASLASRLTGRWRVSAKLLVTVTLSLLATAAAALGFVLWSAQGVDQRGLDHQIALARHVVASQLVRIPHQQQSATIWDDALVHTRLNFDPSWVHINLGLWMKDYYDYDEAIIIDPAGRAIYAMSDGDEVAAAAVGNKLVELQPLIAALRDKIRSGALDAYTAGEVDTAPYVVDLAVVGGHPSIVSIEPIISDSGNIAQALGTEYVQIVLVHLDGDYAARLGGEYLIPGAGFADYGTDTSDRAVIPVANAAGRLVTFFEWTRTTPGREMLNQTVPAIAGALLVAAIIAFVLIDQLWRKSHALETGRADAEHRARHDGLTGLPNRDAFDTVVSHALALKPDRTRRISLLMLDLDRFKQVNDTLGHRAGDDLLEAVGQRLRQLVSPEDVLARLGGDEFAIMHMHPAGAVSPLQLSQRTIEALGKPFDVSGSEAFIGVSIGIATSDGDGSDADPRELARKADIALYEAKATGRNRAVFFAESMNELLQDHRTIEAELREALRRDDQLSVAYQPLYGADHRRIVGAEALARWVHPRLGQVSPARFIVVAEASGLIETLGDFVLRRSCEMGARWPGYVFSVNISPAQLRNPKFPARVFELLAETGMRAADLELEITEGILLEDASTASEALGIFRSSGIRIALDDFGTGYSSLNYLKRYPVDRIKIDRSFVSQLARGDVSLAIVQAMVSLAHALRIEVTAEGVETDIQLELLTELGCNVFQGYLLSPPLTQQAVEALFAASGHGPGHAARVA